MNASESPVFLFHADANPIGGQITFPVNHLLPPHGSSSLAQAGGHSSGRIGPHQVDGVISFQSAHSQVFGIKRHPGGPWTSSVISVVEDFKLLNIVRADAIVLHIKVDHPHDGGEPQVSFAGTHFHNLTISGKRVEVNFDFEAYERNEAQVKAHGGPWMRDERHLNAAEAHNQRVITAEGAPSWVKRRYESMADPAKRSERGHIVCSLVKQICVAETCGAETRKAEYPTYGHIMHVPAVGNLFLGELHVSHGMFRVTMLRAEMGCKADGDVSAASGGTNGTTMPG